MTALLLAWQELIIKLQYGQFQLALEPPTLWQTVSLFCLLSKINICSEIILHYFGVNINRSKACPKRPDGVQILSWSQMLLWNSFTPGRSKRGSSQQLGHKTECFILSQTIQYIEQMEDIQFFFFISLMWTPGTVRELQNELDVVWEGWNWLPPGWLLQADVTEKLNQCGNISNGSWVQSGRQKNPVIHLCILPFVDSSFPRKLPLILKPTPAVIDIGSVCPEHVSKLSQGWEWAIDKDADTHFRVSKRPRDHVCRTREMILTALRDTRLQKTLIWIIICKFDILDVDWTKCLYIFYIQPSDDHTYRNVSIQCSEVLSHMFIANIENKEATFILLKMHT